MEFRETNAGKRALEIIESAIERGESAALLANLGAVVENVYRMLPTGDYGRGNVREVIESALGIEARN